MSTIVLLGPQRLEPMLSQTLDQLGQQHAHVATITAGWEEREAEDEELAGHLGGRTVPLQLFRRYETVLSEDAALRAAVLSYDRDLDRIRSHYRLRLSYALDAARALLSMPDDSPHLAFDRTAAIEAVRRLDSELLTRVAAQRAEFTSRWNVDSHPAVRRQRDEVRSLLEGCAVIAVAGGHVGMLLRAVRLFEIASLLRDRTIIAWSAGAMVMGERIVLFHDHPPQGAGNSEVFDHGLGLFTGLLPCPHARRRLTLSDQQRVALFARRHEPRRIVLMNEGSRIVMERGRLTQQSKIRTVTPEGRVVEWTETQVAAAAGPASAPTAGSQASPSSLSSQASSSPQSLTGPAASPAFRRPSERP